MATGTNLEQDILAARLQAIFERRNGNILDGQAWDAEADELTRRLILMEKRGEWDVLKGSPEHG